MRKMTESLEYLKKAVELLDTDAVIYDHLGDVYYSMGQHQNAKESWEKSLKIASDQAQVQQKLDKLMYNELSVEKLKID